MRSSSMRKQRTSALAGVAMSRYWRASEAEQLLEAWRRSGESVAAFARQHGVSAHRLLRWRRRLQGTGTPVFHPVRVIASDELPRPASLELEVRGGRRIHVPRGFDPELLEELVRTVEGFRC